MELGGRVNKSAQAVEGRRVFYEEMFRCGVSMNQIGKLCGRPHSTVVEAMRRTKERRGGVV